MGDNQGDDTAARRLNAIRSYRFKPSENMLTEETVFLLGQIDARDAEIERLCLAIGGLRLRIEDQGKEIERLRARNATLEAVAEAAVEYEAAGRAWLQKEPGAQRRYSDSIDKLHRAADLLDAQPEPARREGGDAG